MTRDDFIGQLEGYLDEYQGMTPLPAEVRDAIRAELPKTRQIGPLAVPMRYLNAMNKSLQFAIAAAAVLVIAIIGVQLITGGVGGPGGTESPQPSSTPAASEVPSRAPDGLLERGSTFPILVVEGLTATVTVSDADWYGSTRLIDNGSADPPDGAAISVWNGQLDVYSDPCDWDSSLPEPSTAPTVNDLVAALSGQLLRDASTPTDITVDGHPGKAMELTVPADINFDDCDEGQFRTWQDSGRGSRYQQAPSQHDLLWVIDVDGTLVVFDATFYPGTSAAYRAAQQAILESIRFE